MSIKILNRSAKIRSNEGSTVLNSFDQYIPESYSKSTVIGLSPEGRKIKQFRRLMNVSSTYGRTSINIAVSSNKDAKVILFNGTITLPDDVAKPINYNKTGDDQTYSAFERRSNTGVGLTIDSSFANLDDALIYVDIIFIE